jgi:protein-tyrosine phosphatase
MIASEIIDNLYIAKTPKKEDYTFLKRNNFEYLVNMRAEYFWFGVPAKLKITVTRVPTFDIIFYPINPAKLLSPAIEMSEKIKQGKKVLCFCKQGKHRSVAMAACILIVLGYSADEAIKIIKQKRPIADPYANNIKTTIFKFEKLWRSKKYLLSSNR